MNKIFFIIVVLAILLALWFLFPQKTEDPESSRPVKPAKIERFEPSEPEIDEIEIDETLLTETESSKPSAISLNDSDALIKSFLEKVGSGNLIQNIRDEIIRRFVLATYVISTGNIPKQTPFVSTKIPPYKADPVSQDKNTYKPSKSNANRLKPLIQQITQIPPEKFAKVYLDNQTLFQQAFDELGTDRLFDKKLNNALDLIINAPFPPEKPNLIRETVAYQYQNPKYENTKPIIKALWRLGKENQITIQKYCEVLKEELKNR